MASNPAIAPDGSTSRAWEVRPAVGRGRREEPIPELVVRKCAGRQRQQRRSRSQDRLAVGRQRGVPAKLHDHVRAERQQLVDRADQRDPEPRRGFRVRLGSPHQRADDLRIAALAGRDQLGGPTPGGPQPDQRDSQHRRHGGGGTRVIGRPILRAAGPQRGTHRGHTDQMASAIGQRIPMVDSSARVTGQMGFVLDLELPGMLHTRILRSPYAHANVLRVDATRAAALPGVKAVLTRDDLVDRTRRLPHLRTVHPRSAGGGDRPRAARRRSGRRGRGH